MRQFNHTHLFILLLGLVLGGAVVGGPVVARGATQDTSSTPINNSTRADADRSFIYQGRLQQNGSAIDGACDMEFSLWDSATSGSQIGATQSIDDVPVAAGRFTVTLNSAGDFGVGAFDGAARWLGVAIRCGADADFTPLGPRQPLKAVPMAQTLTPGAAIRAENGTALTIETLSTSASSLIIDGHSSNSSFPSLRVNNNGPGGYGLYVNKTNGAGVSAFGANNGTTGSGVAGYSANWYGLYGYTGTVSNNYGIYSPDNLFTRNINMGGATMIVVQNGESGPLTPGDVVSFSGLGFAPEDETLPLPQVGPAGASQTIAGVVYARFDPAFFDAPPEGIPGRTATAEVPVKPGEYLLIVVRGVARVNAGSAAESVSPGAPLHIDAAGRVTAVGAGPVLGPVLDSAGPDAVYVYVDPR